MWHNDAKAIITEGQSAMEQEIKEKKLPDIYINTGKATVLAIIKLIEALAAGYALYYIIMNPQAVQKIVEDFYNGITFSVNTQSSFYSVYQALHNNIQLILAFMLGLIVLDGLGAFFTRFAHKGAGLVRIVHIIRYIFSIIGFIASIYVIYVYISTMVKAAQAANKVGFGDVFAFLGSFELVLYVVFILGAFWILMAYDRYVARAMKQVSLELKTDQIELLRAKNHLGRESAWLCGILGVSAILSVIELVAGESVLANVASFIKPIEILYKGSNVISIIAVAAMAIKFFLVNRCSADFDKAHKLS